MGLAVGVGCAPGALACEGAVVGVGVPRAISPWDSAGVGDGDGSAGAGAAPPSVDW